MFDSLLRWLVPGFMVIALMSGGRDWHEVALWGVLVVGVLPTRI